MLQEFLDIVKTRSFANNNQLYEPRISICKKIWSDNRNSLG